MRCEPNEWPTTEPEAFAMARSYADDMEPEIPELFINTVIAYTTGPEAHRGNDERERVVRECLAAVAQLAWMRGYLYGARKADA